MDQTGTIKVGKANKTPREALELISAAVRNGEFSKDQKITHFFNLARICCRQGQIDVAEEAVDRASSHIRAHNWKLRTLIVERALELAEEALNKNENRIAAYAAAKAYCTSGYNDPRGEPKSKTRLHSYNNQRSKLESFDEDVFDAFEKAVIKLATEDLDAANQIIDSTITYISKRSYGSLGHLDDARKLKRDINRTLVA